MTTPRARELTGLVAPSTRTLGAMLMTGLMLAAGVLCLAGGALMFAGGYSLNAVTSGSMRPGLQPGDLVVLQRVVTTTLKVGDVIAYVPPNRPEPLIHRIVSLQHADGGAVVVQTQGDANNVSDLGPVRLSDTSYRLAASVPLLGWLTVMRAYVWLVVLAILSLMALLWAKGVVRAKLASRS
jgi:signal peptidase I